MKDTLDGHAHAAVVEALLGEPEVHPRVPARHGDVEAAFLTGPLGLGIRQGDASKGIADVRARLDRDRWHRIGHWRGANEGFERVGHHQRRVGGESGHRLQFDVGSFRLTRSQSGVCFYPQRFHRGEVRLEFRHAALGDPPIEEVAHAACRRERLVGHLDIRRAASRRPACSRTAAAIRRARPARTAPLYRVSRSATSIRAERRNRSSGHSTPAVDDIVPPSSWLAVRTGFGPQPRLNDLAAGSRNVEARGAQFRSALDGNPDQFFDRERLRAARKAGSATARCTETSDGHSRISASAKATADRRSFTQKR